MSLMQLRSPHQLSDKRPSVICKDYMPMVENSVMMIYSQGGVGKSYISLRATIHYLMENPTKKSLLWLTEDDEGETRYRFFEIIKTMGIEYNSIKDRIAITDQLPIKFTKMKDGNNIISSELFEIRKELIDYDFVVIDPLLQFQGGEENSNTSAGVFMGAMKDWAKHDKTTILLLHHVAVTQYGLKARGAGDWVNGTRGTYQVSTIKKLNESKEMVDDESKNHMRTLKLTKDNGLGRFVNEKHGSKEFDIDVFPRQFETRYQDDSGRYIASPKVIEYTPSEKDIKALMPDTTNDRTRVAVNISIAPHNNAKNPKGFKKKTIAWDEILDVITMGRAYSPSFFKDDHRSNSNYLGGNEVIFLDIDDGLTIAQAKDMFSDLDAIIVTTKSHQKEKNGIVCDRFRVVIRLDEPMNLLSDEYRSAMTAIFNYFGSVADKQTSDPARFFFSSPTDCEVYYTGGSKTFQWREVYEKAQRIAEIERQSRMSESPKQYTDTTIQDAANALNKIDPDCDYETWFQIGMALQSEFSDAGFQVWDDWSRRGSKYCGEREIQNKWKSFKGSGVGIGTLFHHAKTLGGVA